MIMLPGFLAPKSDNIPGAGDQSHMSIESRGDEKKPQKSSRLPCHVEKIRH
jgi:hypothetical protein